MSTYSSVHCILLTTGRSWRLAISGLTRSIAAHTIGLGALACGCARSRLSVRPMTAALLAGPFMLICPTISHAAYPRSLTSTRCKVGEDCQAQPVQGIHSHSSRADLKWETHFRTIPHSTSTWSKRSRTPSTTADSTLQDRRTRTIPATTGYRRILTMKLQASRTRSRSLSMQLEGTPDSSISSFSPKRLFLRRRHLGHQ